jgi:hypothetical protein
MTMNRHEPFEELISASLHGDLTPDERRRLDAHLDACAQCRATLAAYAEERRMVAGLRHVAPPRDLGARVRAGIEYESVPWWRKPTMIFTAVGGSLAAVAGVLLALVVLNGPNGDAQVGQLSPTPSVLATPGPTESFTPAVSATPAPTLPPIETPAPGETPGPAPTPDLNATPNPIALSSPEPDLYVAVTDNQAMTVRDPSEEQPSVEPADVPAGQPIAAELSPDGGWLAVITERGLSGFNDLSVSRVADATQPEDPDATPIPEPDGDITDTIELGDSVAGSPFLEHLAWAPDGSALAYTLADPQDGDTDVWIFERATGEVWQLTATGDAYAGSWVVTPSTDGDAPAPMLWVSRAEGTVTSYLVAPIAGDGERLERIDPAEEATVEAPHVFQPIVSPNGGLAIYWDGAMTQSDSGEWLFNAQGAPYLAEHRLDDSEEDAEAGPFRSERALFSDVPLDRDAFTSAAIAWGLDGDSYAVWGAAWTGTPMTDRRGLPYPDATRVYFGHASDARGLTSDHGIDASDLPADGSVVDVKVSPTGRHLVVTVRMPTPGDLAVPTARLLLITRNTGDEADIVEPIAEDEGRWYGPAVFDAFVEVPTDAGQEPTASPAASESP